MTECNRIIFKKVDKELNDLYKRLMSKASDEQETYLRAMQRGWIQMKEAQCNLVKTYYRGVTYEKWTSSCKVEMTINRTEDLKQLGTGILWDETDWFAEERIGYLRIGQSEGEANNTIDCPVKRGPEQYWGADGIYHQKWEFVGCGVVLDMASEEKGGVKSIESINATSPSRLRTKGGIGVGSTQQAVEKAYESHWNEEESTPGQVFVAGSVYGGLIFHFSDGHVTKIFLGAAAE